MEDFIYYIKEKAKRTPLQFAVIDGERKINYRDFLDLINSISNNLSKHCSQPRIVFDLNQSIESYALIVAVLNIGGIYCPLNPDAPVERKKQIITEFKADIIVVEPESNIAGLQLSNIVPITQLTASTNSSFIEVAYDPESIIYVIYTSGSTGVPKGVQICRKALNKFLEWSIPAYAATEKDVWGQFSLLSFDLSIVDIFTCLCSGATLLVMAEPTLKLRPDHAIEKNKITIWHSIPSAVEFMIKSNVSSKADLSSLRLMSFCGEPLRKHQVDFLFSKNSDLVIFNTYGPTEGTLFCTCQELRINDYLNYCETTFSIGKPIPGWNFSFSPVPDYTEKEIIIYGDYIGKGYLGDVTDTKFKNLVINGQNINSFETGDLVSEKNGNLFFSCRKDRQIKLKGFRVEPDEIDYWNTEFLKKSSVTVFHNNALYSFIETTETIDEQGARKFLSQKIESYKIPRAFMPISEIPRNANFKVNFSALINLLQ